MNREERLKRFQTFENLRTMKGVSYSQVTRELHLRTNVFSEWKSGKAMPKGESIEKIADYFGVPAKTFY